MSALPTFGPRRIEAIGVLLLLGAVLWWAVVYAQVMANTGFPFARTLPCLVYTSDRCSLAMSLCKDWHFLGIKRYSAELLWVGAAVSVFAIAAARFSGRANMKGNGA
ncbi:hypothetical protein SAZ10_02490 [Mesorhizobium sp. BAC0120]|uniref:hypothetical protein n=1 Tax=Mesorhizobium sp. BAC0120 TaxID=3090670 RepID=UPI00298C93BA|nr:hypothetical protein [Mesorhizobium sp. BAC0120]MDW6020626.1 hypothetical protein [Mesorhizobium sp. BAC0120]